MLKLFVASGATVLGAGRPGRHSAGSATDPAMSGAAGARAAA
jgi:hypothetical protein